MRNTARIPGWVPRRSSRIYYGWWVVGAGSILYILFSGTYVSGVTFYIIPVSENLNISRTSISSVIGGAWIVGAFQGPITGYLVDRLGPRYMIFVGGVLGGLGFVLLAQTNSYLAFAAVFLGLMALGFSGGFDMGIMSTPSRWFLRRSARAYSLLLAGFPMGSAFLAPVVGLLVVNAGWRAAATVSGALMLAFMLPAFMIIRSVPEDVGLRPYGEGEPSPDPSSPEGLPEASLTARQAFRTPTYWLFVLAMALRIAAWMSLMIHFVPIVVWKGRTETEAAILIGVFGLSSIFFRLSMGWICERFNKQRVSSGAMLFGALGVVVLIISGGQMWQLAIYAMMMAVADSGNVAGWAFFGELFGRRAFATLFGTATFVYRLLSAATPILAGLIYDSSGSYFWALVPMTVLLGFSSLVFWNIPRARVGVGRG